jgi:hypothetical protein
LKQSPQDSAELAKLFVDALKNKGLFEVEDYSFDIEQTLGIGSQSTGAGTTFGSRWVGTGAVEAIVDGTLSWRRSPRARGEAFYPQTSSTRRATSPCRPGPRSG